MEQINKILSCIKFNESGLVPTIAQQFNTGEVLMMAWMNKDAIFETLKTKQVCYFSRSRNKLWRKGETSKQIQILKEILVDCDGDSILIKVDQKGVACHTGRRSCFFTEISEERIVINQEIIVPPEELYKNQGSDA